MKYINHILNIVCLLNKRWRHFPSQVMLNDGSVGIAGSKKKKKIRNKTKK